MKLKDEQVYLDWKAKQTDYYGLAIFNYAETWADMMEIYIEGGYKLKDIADKTSNNADTEGISNYMYVKAVSVLVQCWEYGDELKEWYSEKCN